MKKIIAGIVIWLFCSSPVYALGFNDMVSSSANGGKTCTNVASPGTVTQGPPGNIIWDSAGNIISADNKEASVDSHSKNQIKDTAARLVLADGTIGVVDKSNGNAWGGTPENVTYGGDTWGATLTSNDVNNPNFGFALQAGGGIVKSYFLKAANFGFHIASASSVTSVTVNVKRREASLGVDGGTVGYVDQIGMSVCYTSLASGGKTLMQHIPLIFITVGDLGGTRVAPGGVLSIPMTIQTDNTENMVGATIQYQIRRDGNVLLSETDPFTPSGTIQTVKTFAIPKYVIPGAYEVDGSLSYGDLGVTDVIKLPFTVENTSGGMFVNKIVNVMDVLVLFCVCLALSSYLIERKYKRAMMHDYSHVSEPERMYYELIGDIVIQMHGAVGDKAYKIADSVVGLSVDKTTGKILKITKDPSEIASVLIIKYQNLFKKKVKVSARSKNKKAIDNTASIQKNLEKFEKYFRKK